jgi:hypothetical protein
MAAYSINTSRRFALPLALFLLVVLSRYLLPAKLNLKLTSSNSGLRNHVHIQGRWIHLRSALNLPPLPRVVDFPRSSETIPAAPLSRISRFDLKRKRSFEAAAQKTRPPQLYFADAPEQPNVSIERIASSFRTIALVEKGIALEQARARLIQRQGHGRTVQRRPLSWGSRTAKISLG